MQGKPKRLPPLKPQLKRPSGGTSKSPPRLLLLWFQLSLWWFRHHRRSLLGQVDSWLGERLAPVLNGHLHPLIRFSGGITSPVCGLIHQTGEAGPECAEPALLPSTKT